MENGKPVYAGKSLFRRSRIFYDAAIVVGSLSVTLVLGCLLIAVVALTTGHSISWR